VNTSPGHVYLLRKLGLDKAIIYSVHLVWQMKCGTDGAELSDRASRWTFTEYMRWQRVYLLCLAHQSGKVHCVESVLISIVGSNQ
jgi:hypothetical protein